MYLPEDGSFPLYPLFIADLIAGLKSAMFMPQTEGGVFYFAGQEITAFSFAKIWQDFWPDLKISFSADLEVEELGYLGRAAKTAEDLSWRPLISLEEGVEKTISWFNRSDIKAILNQKEEAAEKEIPLVEALPLDFLEKREEEREVNFQAKVKSKDNEEVAAVSEEKISPEESQPLPNKSSPPPPFFDLTDLSAYEEEEIIIPHLGEEIKILENQEAEPIPSSPKNGRKKEGRLLPWLFFYFC